MTNTQNLTPLARIRNTGLGLVFAAVLGGSLVACGGDPGDTTCGEVKDMSTDELIDLLEEGIDEDGDDDDKKAFEDAPQEAKEAGAEALKSACDGEDDDTKLDDI